MPRGPRGRRRETGRRRRRIATFSGASGTRATGYDPGWATRTSSRTFAWSSAWTGTPDASTPWRGARMRRSCSPAATTCACACGASARRFRASEPCTRATTTTYSARSSCRAREAAGASPPPATETCASSTSFGDSSPREAEATPVRSDGAPFGPAASASTTTTPTIHPPGPSSRAGRRTRTSLATSWA